MVIWQAERDGYRLEIWHDDMAENPRQESDGWIGCLTMFSRTWDGVADERPEDGEAYFETLACELDSTLDPAMDLVEQMVEDWEALQ